MTDAWHLAGSLQALLNAVNAHWPGRDKRSDGGIGDARHQAEGSASDHNPWLNNTVRAYDFTVTQLDKGIHGIDGPWFAEQLRLMGQHGDPRLVGGGYVIFNRQITAPDWSHWIPYTQGDPHTTHVHVSVSRNQAGYEYAGPWAFLAAAPLPVQPPHPAPEPAADDVHWTGHDITGDGDALRGEIGDQGPKVRELQHELNETYPAYSQLAEDGDYGHETADVLEEWAHREAVDPHTPPPAADVEGLKTADGLTIGPRMARGLHRDGLI